MFKYINENIDLSIKYSRYYMGLSIILFLLLKSSEYDTISEKLFVSLGIAIGYLMFFNFFRLYLKMQRKVHKYNFEKAKRILKFQANFFIGMSTFMIFLFILHGLLYGETSSFVLLAVNLPIGVALGTTKSKLEHLVE